MAVNKEVKRYIDAVSPERKRLLEQLHAIILGLYPDADVDMSYRMPTYKAKDGWVAIANQKHYVSLYTCGAHHIAEFKKQHPKIKTGTSCINLKITGPIPVPALKRVIRHAIEHPK